MIEWRSLHLSQRSILAGAIQICFMLKRLALEELAGETHLPPKPLLMSDESPCNSEAVSSG